MEAQTKEKKLLWFDSDGFEFAETGLQEMQKDVEYLISCWQVQPVLKNKPFTDENLIGILKDRAEYLRDAIEKVIRDAQDSKVPGLSDQMDIERPQLKGIDTERMERVIDSLHSWRPGSRSDKINIRMISIEKEKPVITDLTLESLKQAFCVYDDNNELSEFIQLGQIAEATIQKIQDLIDSRQKQKEKISGYRLPATLKMFATPTPGQPNAKGLFYKEIKTGTWKFNASKLKR